MTSFFNNMKFYNSNENMDNHDKTRGKWTNQLDFYLACTGHILGLQIMYVEAGIVQNDAVVPILQYALGLILCTIPIYIVESALGQFSSTGFISCFRVAPLFKGVGYVILLFNLVSAVYYSVLTTYPLWYFFMSFSPELPWNSCNNTWNSIDCHFCKEACRQNDLPTFQYFKSYILQNSIDGNVTMKFDNPVPAIESISWIVVGCSLLIWILISLCLINGIKTISKFVRFGMLTSFVLFMIIFIRFFLLPRDLTKLYWREISDIGEGFSWFHFLGVPILNLSCGLGVMMTLSSFNNFKTHNTKYSLQIGGIAFGVTIVLGIFKYLLKNCLHESFNEDIPTDLFFGGFSYKIAETSIPQLWSSIFYLMIFVWQFTSLAIQVFSVLTSIFDEFIILRKYKQLIGIILCLIFWMSTSLYATNIGYYMYRNLGTIGVFTQFFITLIEVLIIVWVYGRERFQNDIKFMSGSKTQTFVFYFIGTVPSTVLFSILIFNEVIVEPLLVTIFAVCPIILITIYAGYKIIRSNGTFMDRLRKNLIPSDWHPANSADNTKYQELTVLTDVPPYEFETIIETRV